jgi:hypothetical protein
MEAFFQAFSVTSSRIFFTATITAVVLLQFLHIYCMCNSCQVLESTVHIVDFYSSRQHEKNNNHTAFLISTVPFFCRKTHSHYVLYHLPDLLKYFSHSVIPSLWKLSVLRDKRPWPTHLSLLMMTSLSYGLNRYIALRKLTFSSHLSSLVPLSLASQLSACSPFNLVEQCIMLRQYCYINKFWSVTAGGCVDVTTKFRDVCPLIFSWISLCWKRKKRTIVFTAVGMNSFVFWDITQCSLFKSTDVSEKHVASTFRVEE